MIADINLAAAQVVAALSTEAAVTAGFQVKAVWMDMSKEESVAAAIAQTVGAFGRVDYCVNCAGVGMLLNQASNRVNSKFWSVSLMREKLRKRVHPNLPRPWIST